MASGSTYRTFTPQTKEDSFRISPAVKILPTSAGVHFKPLGGGPLDLTEEDLAAVAKRTKAIADASKDYNESKGRSVEEVEREETVSRELRRLHEESKSFVYTNPYFAGPQVGAFIADKWVSNIVTLEYTESSTDSPVYGYASRHYDAVMEGNVLVQGNFTVAFTDGDYLGKFLENYHVTEGQNDGSSEEGAKDAISRAKDLWWGTTGEKVTGAVVPMNFRHSSGLTGSVGRGFDIRVYYGAREFIEAGPDAHDLEGSIEVIKDVHITGRNIVVAPTGDPIGEGWTFFARSVQTLQGDRPPASLTRPVSLRRDEPPSQANKLWLPIRNLGQTIRLGSV